MSSSNGKDNAPPRQNQTEGSGTVPKTGIEFIALGEKPPRGKPRYRDPENPFNTWGGRGKRPKWLAAYLEEGRCLDDFKIEDIED